MNDTPNLRLPFIMAAQAQKHVTHNEALRHLDALVQLAVIDRDLTAPPGSPAEGDRYIVAAGATGAWVGHDNEIAAFQDAAWAFRAAKEGWLAWVGDEDQLYTWSGTAWARISDSDLQNVPMIGINTTADATNRLSVSSPVTLFNHEGAGHQLKLNKNLATDTASLLFQTGFSGRAEFGATGDDDFHVKVSPDGTVWKDAILVDKTTAQVTFPNTTISGGRETLTANRTYYVRTDGNDSNSGRVDSAAGAFLTIQKAVDAVSGGLDLNIFDVTIDVGNGTYTGATTLKPFVGSGKVIIVGDETTPSNILISTTSANCFEYSEAITGTYHIRGVKMQTATLGNCFDFQAPGVVKFQNCDFGVCARNQILASNLALVRATGNYTISGGGFRHFTAIAGGICYVEAVTVTISNQPAFSVAFASALRAGVIYTGVSTYVAADAPATITGITQANPAVVTATAHGFTNGQVIEITGVVGMTEVNDRQFTVANATANTFELQGEDSTLHTAYVSGGTATLEPSTGKRHSSIEQSAIVTNGGGAKHYPGDVAGTTATDGSFS